MRRYIRFVINNRVSIVLLMVLATCLSIYIILSSRDILSSSITDMFFGDSPRFKIYQERVKQFANDQVIMVGIEEPEPLSPESLERLSKLVNDLEDLTIVRRVHSILDLYKLDRTQGTLLPRTYAEMAMANPGRTSELTEKMIKDPLARQILVSKDGKHSLVVIEIFPSKGSSKAAEKTPRLMEIITGVFIESGYSEENIHKAGIIPLASEMIRQTKYSLAVVLPLIVAVLFVTVFVIYRRVWPIIIAGAVSITAVIWTLGMAVFVFDRISILMAVVPGVIMVVSFSDVVHLCNAYSLELSSGLSKRKAVFKSCSEVGRACIYTSLTTLVGFFSLSLVPAPVFKEMGIALAFGVAASLLLAVTLSPILFYYLKEPPHDMEGEKSRVRVYQDRALDYLRRSATARPILVVVVFAALAAAAVAGTYMIEFETDFIKRFSKDSEIGRDARYFDRHFAGTNYLEVYIDLDEKNGLTDPEFFSRLSVLEDELESLPEVDLVYSVFDYMDALYPRLHPELYEEHPTPPQRAIIYQYLLLLEGTVDPVEHLIDRDFKSMRLSLRLADGGLLSTRQTGQKVNRLISKTVGEEARVDVSGMTLMLGDWLAYIIYSQRRGFGFAFVAIMLMMAVALRSWRSGVISMVPNIFPLLVLGGYLGFFYDKVDSDTMAVALIALGIGVDDTIHFLTRFSGEREKGYDVDKALKNTFHYSGRAIVITTVVLVAGFLPFNLADYSTTRMNGTLLPLCLVFALAADLILLPALVKLRIIKVET